MLRNGRRALPAGLSGRVRGRLRRALGELAVTIGRTATIVAQARSRLAGQMPDGATRLVSLHDPDAGRSARAASTSRSSSDTRPRSLDNDDGIILDYGVQAGNPRTLPSLHQRSAGSRGAPAHAPFGHRRPRLRRARHRTGTAGPQAYARSPSRAEPDPQPPAARSSMPAASVPSSSGEPAAKAGSATSSADTAGTAPGWTAARELPSGAGTGYSATTWSRSAPLPADLPGPDPRMPPIRRPRSAFDFFRTK